MAVLVGHIRNFGQLFGLIQFSEDDAEAVWTIYRQDLDDLPFAVLIEAFARLRRSWRWKSLPKPGDIRAEAEKLMEGWTTARLRLETAARWREITAAVKACPSPRMVWAALDAVVIDDTLNRCFRLEDLRCGLVAVAKT